MDVKKYNKKEVLGKVLGASLIFILFASLAEAKLYDFGFTASYLRFAEENKSRDKDHLQLEVDFISQSKKEAPFVWKLQLNYFESTFPDYELSLPEFYIGYRNKKSLFIVGRRKIRNISYLDEDWTLGIQTAFVRNNPFFSAEQGRSGFIYELSAEQVEVDFYISPFSFPSQSATYQVDKEGLIRSPNPWAILPPEYLVLDSGAELKLNYDLEEDSLPDVIVDHQYGGVFSIKTEDIKISAMYSNRPSKQIGFELNAKLQTDNPGNVSVTAVPRFFREHFFGVQAESIWFPGLSMKNGFYGLLKDTRKGSKRPYQTASYDYFMATTSLHNKFKYFDFSLSYLFQQQKQNKEEGVTYIDTDRFLYSDALMLELENFSFSKKFKSDFKALYLTKERIINLILRSEYFFKKNLSAFAFINMVHNFRGNNEGDNYEDFVSYLKNYSSLDTFSLGVKYVF